MQLKSSVPLSSANTREKLQEANSLCGIGITQHGLKSLERYLSFTQNDDSPASSQSPPSRHWHICPHDEKRKVVGRCAVLCHHNILDHMTLTLTLARVAIGSWWQRVISVSYPKMHHLFLRTTVYNVQDPYCLCMTKDGHFIPPL